MGSGPEFLLFFIHYMFNKCSKRLTEAGSKSLSKLKTTSDATLIAESIENSVRTSLQAGVHPVQVVRSDLTSMLLFISFVAVLPIKQAE